MSFSRVELCCYEIILHFINRAYLFGGCDIGRQKQISVKKITCVIVGATCVSTNLRAWEKNLLCSRVSSCMCACRDCSITGGYSVGLLSQEVKLFYKRIQVDRHSIFFNILPSYNFCSQVIICNLKKDRLVKLH